MLPGGELSMLSRISMGACLVLSMAALLSTAATVNDNGNLEDLLTQTGCDEGMIAEETSEEVRFQIVTRKPGRPTVAFFATFPRAEIKKIDKLTGKDREELVARLAALDPA